MPSFYNNIPESEWSKPVYSARVGEPAFINKDGGVVLIGNETGFITKDSGERVEYDSGMRRDVNTGKDRFDLIPIPMLKRLAGLYGRGAVKYGDWNWKLANTEEEMNRFKESAFRHFMQWANGEADEDHAMAVVFNLFGYETTKEKLSDG